MKFLNAAQIDRLTPAETLPFRSPIPTQIVASDEFAPTPQTAEQRQVEARLKELGSVLAKKRGMSRRRFFQTASGMAAGFVALNEVFGNIFEASRAEAATADMADERAAKLKHQFVMDTHTHFLRDDTRIMNFVKMRESVGSQGWNPELKGKPQTIDDLKFANYFKEIYLDSDTKVALVTSAPSDIPQDWFLTNQQAADARANINKKFGARRALSHAIFTPGQPGWLEEIDKAVEVYKPDSWKGYTVGDNTHKDTSRYPWRLDDEKLVYPAYEKFVKSGIKNVCIHKGLFAPAVEKQFPHLRPFADVSDVGKAAKDWPQLNFLIYHSAYRHIGGSPADAWAEFSSTGRCSWVSDLCDIPHKYGVKNVYADLGQVIAFTTVAQPRMGAAIMGMMVKHLGPKHVIWGTDAVWTGAPQWQIEGLRRMEIPEDMQKKYGFKPLGPANGALKNAIFGQNVARLYKFDHHAELNGAGDRHAAIKADYEANGPGRSNLRYGYVAKRA